jgi:2-(1,2-epoxy-1,2-dihydrophenyl)acetyl-CoA isomerase
VQPEPTRDKGSHDHEEPRSAPLRQAEFIETKIRWAIAIIRLNRPEVRNAINDRMRQDLIAAFDLADQTAAIRAVVLTWAGKGFCSCSAAGSGVLQRPDAP